MANERTYVILPCPEIDADIAVRLDRVTVARASLEEVDALELAPSERDGLADDRDHTVRLIEEAEA